jgi:hypothetical protein
VGVAVGVPIALPLLRERTPTAKASSLLEGQVSQNHRAPARASRQSFPLPLALPLKVIQNLTRTVLYHQPNTPARRAAAAAHIPRFHHLFCSRRRLSLPAAGKLCNRTLHHSDSTHSTRSKQQAASRRQAGGKQASKQASNLASGYLQPKRTDLIVPTCVCTLIFLSISHPGRSMCLLPPGQPVPA